MACILNKYQWTRKLRIRDQNSRELLSEMLGTFVLTLFSVAGGAQFTIQEVISPDKSFSTFLSINIANGFGVTLAIYSCGNVSGGCVNPAVSLAFCLTGRLPWRRLPFHVIGQILGAFLAACLVYAVYKEPLELLEHMTTNGDRTMATAGIFCFFPQDYLSNAAGLLDSTVGSAMLILAVLSLADPRNMNPGPGFVSVPVGLCVLVIGTTFGINCAYPINPARDFGPRLFLLAAGWGTEAFSYRDYWFWVPIVGPLLGTLAATCVYWFLVELHWPQEETVEDMKVDVSPVLSPSLIHSESTAKLTTSSSSNNNISSGNNSGFDNTGYVGGSSDATRF